MIFLKNVEGKISVFFCDYNQSINRSGFICIALSCPWQLKVTFWGTHIHLHTHNFFKTLEDSLRKHYSTLHSTVCNGENTRVDKML